MNQHKIKITPKLILIVIVVVAALLRLWYAWDLPLNGDEVGVGVLQASGQAKSFRGRLPRDITSLDKIKSFIEYNPGYSVKDVVDSLHFSGMHPPFYYLVLHYVLKFFGNDVLTLRLLSIFISLGSVVALFYLGKTLYSQTVGLYGSLLFAVASYGVTYGSLVRPYPLAMFLSLLSTTLAINLARRSTISFKDLKFLGYISIAILGIYAIYQFFFIVAFQVSYLVLSHFRNRKNLITLGTGISIIALSFIPWIPALRTHLSDITSHQYYFHQDFNLWRFIVSLITLNFNFFFTLRPIILGFVIGLMFYVFLGIGLYVLCRRATRQFVLALAIYLGAYFGAEQMLQMSTIIEPKFLFFVMPIALLLVVIGVFQLSPNNRLLTGTVLGGFGALLLINSIIISIHKNNFASKEHLEINYVRDFAPIINSDSQKKLILFNTYERRYLFPLVHALFTPSDIYIVKGTDITKGAEGSSLILNNYELSQYSRLYLLNLYVGYDSLSFLSTNKLDVLSEVLERQNFNLTRDVMSGNPKKHSLLIFDKTDLK